MSYDGSSGSPVEIKVKNAVRKSRRREEAMFWLSEDARPTYLLFHEVHILCSTFCCAIADALHLQGLKDLKVCDEARVVTQAAL